MPCSKAPWRDRAGRFSGLKLLALMGLCLPAVFLLLDWRLGNLGPRPITEAILTTGQWTERLLLGTLALTPLRFVLQAPRLVLVRRMIGIATLAYALAHVSLYVLDQKFLLLHVAAEIFLRFYLTIGFVALLGLIALGVTSTDATVRRMGKTWKRLHRAAYAIAALTVVHYTLQSRPNISGPALAFGIFAWLMLWRALPPAQRQAPLALLLLTIVVVPLTAGVEAGWYGLFTGINYRRVLAANLDPSMALRPAGEAAVIGLAVVVLAALRRAMVKRTNAPNSPLGPRRERALGSLNSSIAIGGSC